MTGTRTLTIQVPSTQWGEAPRTSFSRSASEQALARLGWKSVNRAATTTACYELVAPNQGTSYPTPSIWMHGSCCLCKTQPTNDAKPLPQDDLLHAKIIDTARTYRHPQPPPKLLHPNKHTGLISLTRYLAPEPASTAHQNISRLCQACAKLDINLITHLLFEANTPINGCNNIGTTPLLAAITASSAFSFPKSHSALISLLLDHGADPNMVTSRPGTQPSSPLATAVALGVKDVVRLLLRYGANVNLPLSTTDTTSKRSHRGKGKGEGVGMGTGMTPIHIAVFADQPACLEHLLQRGAKVDAVFQASSVVCPIRAQHDSAPESPTGSLRHKRQSETPKAHHSSKMKLIEGVTALHLAHRSSECARILLRYGACLNACDGTGRTPLHWAAGSRTLGVVDVLVAAGANGNIKDLESETPLDVAMRMVDLEGATKGEVEWECGVKGERG